MRTFKYIILNVVIIFLLASCNNQSNQREKISELKKDELIKQIANENIVMGSAVGVAGAMPDQWLRYTSLFEKLNEQETLALTDHSNNTVKCYAFMDLLAKKGKDVFPVLLKKLSDTGKVETLFGCLGGSESVREFCIKETINNKQITQTQRQTLDSIIFLKGEYDLISRFNILETIPGSATNYAIAKQRVNQNPEYIVLISKFSNPGDSEMILNFLKSPDQYIQYLGLQAVAYFPDKSFFPTLSEIAKSNYETLAEKDKDHLFAIYEALVQYKNKESKNILKQAIRKANGMDSLKKIDLVYIALKKHPDSIYKNLIQYF